MGSMVNCKTFYQILYLIKRLENYTIYTYLKGVMAARLGESQRYKKDSKVLRKKSQIKRLKITNQNYEKDETLQIIIKNLRERDLTNFWGRRLLG